MIDLDRMEEQLARAVTADAVVEPVRAPAVARPPAPTPAPAPAPPRREAPLDVRELLELGLVEEADARMAVATDRADVVTWATMRALLAGRQDTVRAGVDELRALARATDDPGTWGRYWAQRFWAAFEWGSDEERYEVLDHCRQRAYRFDDLDWWGRLTLLLAAMGKADEAGRAFDAAWQQLDRRELDPATDLLEAAALLGDPARVSLVHRAVRWPEGRLVVVGPGLVCKGSVDRYSALGAAAGGDWGRAGELFRRAEATHRAIGAGPLLTRTLQQASGARTAA